MQLQQVFDESGFWFTNKGSFPFVDPTNGCRFEPNVRTKAPRTAWIAAQAGVIVPEPGQDKPEPKQEPKQPAK